LVFAVSALACACSGATDLDGARAALIRDTMIRTDQTWRVREPALVAGKLAKMAESRFLFLRGTARLYWSDVTRGTPIASTTAYGSIDAARVLIIGDPHLENLGTFRAADGAMLVDWNDFDATTWGPYWDDVRRLAVACYVAGLDIGPAVDAGALADAAARAYADELEALAGGPVAPLAYGTYLDDLASKAAADGAAGGKLAKYTTVTDGVRAFDAGVIDPVIVPGVIEDELVPLDAAAATTLIAAIDRWSATVWAASGYPAGALRVTGGVGGVTRRLGSGVSSYALVRYYAILAGATASPADDLMIELKEASDPVILPGVPHVPPATDRSNSERVVRNQRQLHAGPDDDPLIGWTGVGNLALQVRSRTGYQNGVDVAKIGSKVAAGKLTAADVTELCDRAGRLLARAHARGTVADGAPALAAIAVALHGDVDGFVAETGAFARAYGAQTDADYALFKQLLVDDGPLLGGAP
jgi:uncharacterized protein (DUF2252 family)